MTTTKTTPSLPIGLTPIKEGYYYIPGRLVPWLEFRTIVSGPAPKRAHQLQSCKGLIKTHYVCRRCGFKTNYICDLRANKGCHMFANSDKPTGKLIDWVITDEKRKIRLDLADEKPIEGYNSDGSKWLRYPNIGKAWQEDKFINEQVAKEMKKYVKNRSVS
jgi:hypothetical protein